MKKLPIVLLLYCGLLSANDVKCLSETIYSEARGEDEKGKLGVGHTVLTRMKKSNKSACAVIRSAYTRKPIPIEYRDEFIVLARSILAGNTVSPIGDRDSFNDIVHNKQWVKKAKNPMRIGNLVFHRG